MSAIEPNWLAMLWFALFATIAGIAFLVVAGRFPLRAQTGEARPRLTAALAIGNAVLLGALLIGTGLYGYTELRWSTLVVVTGLIILFAPGLFEEWRWPLGGARAELLVLVGVQGLALLALSQIGGAALALS